LEIYAPRSTPLIPFKFSSKKLQGLDPTHFSLREAELLAGRSPLPWVMTPTRLALGISRWLEPGD
jgi:hypothetical protein